MGRATKKITLTIPNLSPKDLQRKVSLRLWIPALLSILLILSVSGLIYNHFRLSSENKKLQNDINAIRNRAKEQLEVIETQKQKLEEDEVLIVNIATFALLQEDIRKAGEKHSENLINYGIEQENASMTARAAVDEILSALSCTNAACIEIYGSRARDQLKIYNASSNRASDVLEEIKISKKQLESATEAMENFLLNAESQNN